MSINILWPWKMVGRYADETELIANGNDEDECMCKLIDQQEKHGELIWYSGYSDEDYEAGEYIGKENFVYE